MAFSSLSGVIEPFSHPAAPSWMSFFPFFSDRLLIINTGISVADGVCTSSTPSISGRSMARRIMLGYLPIFGGDSPHLPPFSCAEARHGRCRIMSPEQVIARFFWGMSASTDA